MSQPVPFNAPLAPAELEDPLVAALQFVGRHFGRPVSAETIMRSLPRENGRLPAAYVPEAAERAGLVARQSLVDVPKLGGSTLPVILPTKAGGAWVAIERKHHKLLVWTGSGDEAAWLTADALAAEVTAAGFYVQPRLYFDERSRLYDATNEHEWFWKPLRENWWIYLNAGMASLFINGLAMIASFYVMSVYDRVIPNRSMDTLWVLTLGVVMLYLIDLVLKSIKGYLIDAASRRFDLQVGSKVFAKALALKPTNRPASAGTLANTIREFESLREFFTSATLAALGDVPFLFAFVLVIALFAGPVALVPTLAIPIILGMSAAFVAPMKRVTDVSYRESAQRTALLYEVVTGIDTLKTQGCQAWARGQWDRMLAKNSETMMKTRQWASLSLNTTMEAQALVGVGVIVVAAYQVSDGKLSTGAMVASSILAGRAIQPLAQLAGLVGRIHTTRASLAALDKLMQSPSEDAGDRPLLHLPSLHGDVALREVVLNYPDGSTGTATPALKGATLSIKAGERVAFLGRVGSGKSSILSLIVKLYEPDEGNVTVDGLDVRQLASADLRAQIGYVPQDPFLFFGTVRENLTMAHPGASEAAILRACQVAGLDELLGGTSQGLNMQVGEGGKRLSGGMRQAVALARALVADPPVLLLDEPTSMMDQATERRVLASLAEVRQGKTTIVVTHRPAVLDIVERVIIIDDGRVVADGPKAQVMSGLVRAPQQA